jgi:hypothetical protein
MNLGQVAKDKNLLLVVEKNLVMNEIQNLLHLVVQRQ